MRYIAYTDGSYKETPYGAVYSSAAIIGQEGSSEVTQLTKVTSDEYVNQRNVAGEVMAVMMVMEHCLNVLKLKQTDTLVLHYDYVGIHNWCKKKGDKDYWKAKNKLSQTYRDYINLIVRPTFNIEFVHTPGHTGIYGNEKVDELAKKAIDLFVAKTMNGV